MIRLPRTSALLSEALLLSGATFWVHISCYLYICVFYGYGGALSRHMFVCSVMFVEACSHVCGSWVQSVCMWSQSVYIYICMIPVCVLKRPRMLLWPMWPSCSYVCVCLGDVYSASFDSDLMILHGRPLRIAFVLVSV